MNRKKTNKFKHSDLEFRKIFSDSKTDVLWALDREGDEESVLYENKKTKNKRSRKIFPVVSEKYRWSRKNQISGAEKFRDRIEYIYYPEQDKLHPMMKTWRKDDNLRLGVLKKLPYGNKVLETGCSSGTVTIEIAKLPKVKEIVGIDIRKSAITLARKLTKDLANKKYINKNHLDKINFKAIAIEDLSYPKDYFDTVCAFEVLEHLTQKDFDVALPKLSKILNPKGSLLISVPNRYPAQKYIKEGRIRWKAPDHKNYFSKTSLEYLLKKYFEKIVFYSIDGQAKDRGVYLICECINKK